MRKLIFLFVVCLCMISCKDQSKPAVDISTVASPNGTEVFQPDWENIASNYHFPEWFQDAKFGIFMHWGVYAVPAFKNEWYPREMYLKDSEVYKHHIETYGTHDKFGYKDFIPMFKAEKFNADEWVALFKEAGARYVVPVAEHHDGFSMYDSDLNEWNSVKMGPKKDIVGLLKEATEKAGLVFGLSSHKAENGWFYNGGMEFPSDVQDSTLSIYGGRYEQEKYTEEWGEKWLKHTYELINKYQPSLFWFDWTVHNPVLMPYFNRFLAYYYNNALDWGKDVVVNTKQGYPTNIQVWDMERGKTDRMMEFPWQTDTSVGIKSWCYIDGEQNKTPQQIVHDLIDIVSKNGNLLLNIGPKADGTISEEQQAVLRSIGAWLKINGEAIYGTRCWKRFGECVTDQTKGSFTDHITVDYSVQDIRFTTKGNDFYVTTLNWGDRVTIHSLTKETVGEAQIREIRLLGSESAISWRMTEDGLEITFPKEKPCDYAYSFKISFDQEVGKNMKSEASNVTLKHG